MRFSWKIDGATATVTAVFVFFFGVITLLVYGVALEARQWETFVIEHSCKKIGNIRGDVMTTVATNGTVAVTTTPDKTGWLCDDGVTYWR